MSSSNLNQPRLLIFATLCVILAFLLFSEEETNPKLFFEESNNVNKPEAFVSEANFTLYDKKGFATQLNSEKAMFYSHSDRIDIDAIDGTLTNQQGAIIKLSANKGHIEPSNNTITLIGDVLIQQTYPEDKKWSIQGQEFLLDKQQSFISSAQAVTITRNKSVIRAVGIQAWLDEKRIELLSNVRGKYAFSD